jgi:hypothetical protein
VTIVAAAPNRVFFVSFVATFDFDGPRPRVTFVAAVSDVVRFVSLWQQCVVVATFDFDKAPGG